MARIACVGTRDISFQQAGKLSAIGKLLARRKNIIVTGNAEGADSAFASGANEYHPARVRQHLPWPNFRAEHIYPGNGVVSKPTEACYQWAELVWDKYRAGQYGYTDWNSLSDSTRALMARNWSIVADSDRMIAAPKFDGKGRPRGGTGFAIKCAEVANRPVQVINLGLVEPPWDKCRVCGLGRLFWDCGAYYHALMAYA